MGRAQSLAAAGKLLWPIPDRGLDKRIHRIRAPTLLIWGESDGLIPPVYGNEFQRRIEGSRLVVLAQCSHMLMYERPAEFAQAIIKFLKA